MKKDLNQLAYHIMKQATEPKYREEVEKTDKNPNAVALGRLGGLKGGKARAEKLTPERKLEISKKAIAARWKKK